MRTLFFLLLAAAAPVLANPLEGLLNQMKKDVEAIDRRYEAERAAIRGEAPAMAREETSPGEARAAAGGGVAPSAARDPEYLGPNGELCLWGACLGYTPDQLGHARFRPGNVGPMRYPTELRHLVEADRTAEQQKPFCPPKSFRENLQLSFFSSKGSGAIATFNWVLKEGRPRLILVRIHRYLPRMNDEEIEAAQREMGARFQMPLKGGVSFGGDPQSPYEWHLTRYQDFGMSIRPEQFQKRFGIIAREAVFAKYCTQKFSAE